MSEPSTPKRGPLRAVLRQVETNLYRAEYGGEINPDKPDERAIPDYHIGTDAAGVKLWVEQMATSLGYESVVWDASTDAGTSTA